MTKNKPFFLRDPWQYHSDCSVEQPAAPCWGFDTRALHTGFHPLGDPTRFRSFTPPLVQSVTYPYEAFEKIPCPVYGRTRTPTNTVLEERLADLEGGQACVSAASGSQALFNLIFTITRPGDNVVTSLNIFGEGYKQAAEIFPQRCQVYFRFVDDPSDPGSWDAQIDARTKLVWVETPSNPCLFVTDIRAVADVAHARGIPLLVDNTTATAALQHPMELGADMVLLSISKFLSGNGSLLGGALVGPEDLVEDIRWNTTEFIGAVMPSMEAWMTLQYLETLSMRMQRHSQNGQRLAEFLASHPKVTAVNYPGLDSHPQHALAQRQMSAGGGLLSFSVKNGRKGAARVMDRLQLVVHAVTFGTSRTICMHPASITHEHMTAGQRRSAGIEDGLIRLSAGLENTRDIIDDLERALQRA